MNTRTNNIALEPVSCVRSGFAMAPMPSRASEARDYLRRLREAEMAAWELTGGDYLLSQRVSRAAAR